LERLDDQAWLDDLQEIRQINKQNEIKVERKENITPAQVVFAED
jgi:hypothetical protein